MTYIRGTESSTRRLNNGLPQNLVLVPTLLNLYNSNLPTMTSRIFVNTDNIMLTEHKQFKNNEIILNCDNDILNWTLIKRI